MRHHDQAFLRQLKTNNHCRNITAITTFLLKTEIEGLPVLLCALSKLINLNKTVNSIIFRLKAFIRFTNNVVLTTQSDILVIK